MTKCTVNCAQLYLLLKVIVVTFLALLSSSTLRLYPFLHRLRSFWLDGSLPLLGGKRGVYGID